MHLSFCPIAPDKKLSAKSILGNQAQLSRWQTEFHATMSSRWPELERGISSMETGRKHIPLSLFKQAERLDKQIAAVETAINDIGIIGNAKKRQAAVKVLHEWLPRAQYFTAQVNKVDGHIKALEQKERDAQARIALAKERGERLADQAVSQVQTRLGGYIKTLEQKEYDAQERIALAEKRGERSADHAIAQMQTQLDKIKKLLREERERSDKLRRQCYNQETLIYKIPLELRDKLMAQMKPKKERGGR